MIASAAMSTIEARRNSEVRSASTAARCATTSRPSGKPPMGVCKSFLAGEPCERRGGDRPCRNMPWRRCRSIVRDCPTSPHRNFRLTHWRASRSMHQGKISPLERAMTTNTMEPPILTEVAEEVVPQVGARVDPWILTGPILVATDGTDSSDAVMRVADAIARDHGLSAQAISVLEPLASIYAPVDGLMVGLPSTISDMSRAETRMTSVRDRLRKTLRTSDSWKVQVRIGQVAASIVDAATEIDASLIVLGLGRHRPVDRLLGDEVAAQVVRRASIPVSAVSSAAAAPLLRAVVGIDFSRAAVRAARSSMSITTPPGHVWLAHVKAPLDIPTEAYEGSSVIYTQGVLGAFKKIQERLEPVDLLEVRPVVLEGRVADELLGFATTHRADLIVTGAHGRTLVERLLIGSVTTKVLRAARCSVLVIPPNREDREPRV